MSEFKSTHKVAGKILIGKRTKWETTVVHTPTGTSHTIVSEHSHDKAVKVCTKELKKKLDNL